MHDERVSHLLVLIGTRPEAIKMFPLVHALRRSTPTSYLRFSSLPASSPTWISGSATQG